MLGRFDWEEIKNSSILHPSSLTIKSLQHIFAHRAHNWRFWNDTIIRGIRWYSSTFNLLTDSEKTQLFYIAIFNNTKYWYDWYRQINHPRDIYPSLRFLKYKVYTHFPKQFFKLCYEELEFKKGLGINLVEALPEDLTSDILSVDFDPIFLKQCNQEDLLILQVLAQGADSVELGKALDMHPRAAYRHQLIPLRRRLEYGN